VLGAKGTDDWGGSSEVWLDVAEGWDVGIHRWTTERSLRSWYFSRAHPLALQTHHSWPPRNRQRVRDQVRGPLVCRDSRLTTDDSPGWQGRKGYQGQGRQKGCVAGRSLAFITQAAFLCDVPPTKDVEAPSRPQVPAEIDSARTQNGRVPDYRFVRVAGALLGEGMLTVWNVDL
jgi:hypothetical protein